jgi:hypothetical protein
MAGSNNEIKGVASKVEIECEPEPEPIDVSIPYDAAILMAYDAWRIEGDRGDFNEQIYKKFKATYITKAVAEATTKKAVRDLAALS